MYTTMQSAFFPPIFVTCGADSCGRHVVPSQICTSVIQRVMRCPCTVIYVMVFLIELHNWVCLSKHTKFVKEEIPSFSISFWRTFIYSSSISILCFHCTSKKHTKTYHRIWRHTQLAVGEIQFFQYRYIWRNRRYIYIYMPHHSSIIIPQVLRIHCKSKQKRTNHTIIWWHNSWQ